ncbi:hypothetical protein ACFYV7_00005, partial [Nocardia suismassiliense]
MSRKLCLAQDVEADELLTEDHFATLLGMLLDQLRLPPNGGHLVSGIVDPAERMSVCLGSVGRSQ